LGLVLRLKKVNSGYYLIFYASFCSFPFLFIYYYRGLLLRFCYFEQFLCWEMVFVLSLRFIIKFPVYFLHLWLPKAHVESPTTGRILLAGLLLKLGTAGFVRLLKVLRSRFTYFWILISFLGMLLGALCCIFQSDSKSLAAYSSISHIRFLLISLLYFFLLSKSSRLILILIHGYTSTLMFYLIGEFYHTSSTRMIYYFSGLFGSSLLISLFFGVVMLRNGGVPPFLSFLSEFVTIGVGLGFRFVTFIIFFFYFFFAFYFCMFLLVSSFLGKACYDFNNWNIGLTSSIVFIFLNLFWVGLIL